ncbi:MAG: trypsin-like peptidase domain-containing protein, partial [Planctomycetaceae bacterium]|nr:trypsin-like peptidase domain-containing protein [Planctomycetaceae bacterium]
MSFLRITPFAVAVLVVVTIAGTAHAQRKICAPQGCWIEPTAVVPVAPAAIRPVNTLPIPAVKVWIDLDATPQETIFTSANGVVISESEAETLIVTNAHVITQAEQVRIGTTPAEIVFSDAITDLAFLRVEGRLPNTGVARIRATELGFGEPCWYYGYLPPSWNLGYMKGRRLRRDEIRWLTISLVSREGMSGGGVYDDAGQLVGILSRGFQADTQVVPVSMVMDLLNRYRQSQQPDQLTDVERRQKELFDALQATRAELERMKETPKLVIPDDRPDLIEPWPGEGNSPGVIGEVVKVPADPGMPPVEQRPHSAPGGTLWGRAKGWAWDSLSGWMWGAIGASVA